MSSDFGRSEVRAAWRRRLLGPLDDSAWENMARELFAWQFVRVPAYRRLCRAHGVTPGRLDSWRSIPAVPQQLFKRTRLFAQGVQRPAGVYETSGTTTGEPGRQFLWRTDLYRAVGVEGARRAGFLADEAEFHFLVPSPAEAPHSSLSAMFAFWQQSLRQKGPRFWVQADRLEFSELRRTLEKLGRSGRPVALCGTAFSFVHLLDAWKDRPLHLPAGSRLLETGGFKGRSREVSKTKLYAALRRLFGVTDRSIWNEYGMSELSSQAYARGATGRHRAPSWASVLIVDPASGREVAPGRTGLVRWYDLANIDSVLALQTLDLARREQDGFQLIGRLARTEPRGCSLGADDLAAREKKESAP